MSVHDDTHPDRSRVDPVKRWAAAGLLGAIAATAHAGSRFVLLDDTLRARTVEVLAIDQRGVTIDAGSGEVELVPMSSLAALLPVAADTPVGLITLSTTALSEMALAEAIAAEEDEQPDPMPDPAASSADIAAAIELIDGQRFVATLDAAEEPSETLRIRLTTAGDASLPLEALRRLRPAIDAESAAARLVEPPAISGPALDDVVLLSNGDRLEGFAAGISGSEVAFEVAGSERALPIGAIDELVLANPDEPPAGVLVQLRDGSIYVARTLRAREPSIAGGDTAGTLELVLALDPIQRTPDRPDPRSTPHGSRTAIAVSIERIAALLAPTEGTQLIPLAKLDVHDVTPGPGRRWAPPPTIEQDPAAPAGAAAVVLDGPQVVRFDLPTGARAFTTRATLGPVPGPWADCVVVVRRGGRELARAALSPANPDAQLHAELTPDSTAPLTIEILEGANGPLHDRVRLEHALLLVETDSD